jgi:hypothetical protein
VIIARAAKFRRRRDDRGVIIVKARRHLRPSTLVVGDAAVLVLWAVIGLVNHEEGVTFTGVLRNAGPIMIGWFAAALLLRTYRRPARAWRFLATWAIGISAGVVLRAGILSKPWNGDELAFFGVTLAVTLVLLVAWRALAEGIARAVRH